MGLHRRGGRAGRADQRGGPVNIKAFFVDALTSALDLGIALGDDYQGALAAHRLFDGA